MLSSYCASPISGMGTTLAMTGAYNLAGALLQHEEDIPTALEQYEAKMRPVVHLAQKLAPGMPYLMNPETAWGVTILHLISYCIAAIAPIMKVVIRKFGPPASQVPVDDYGFKVPPEMLPEELGSV